MVAWSRGGGGIGWEGQWGFTMTAGLESEVGGSLQKF